MKKQEKTQLTRERILAAALAEFGTKSYDQASINAICSESQISKGLLYHNFKSKDELYLYCVSLCYQKMMAYIREKESACNTAESSIQQMMAIRQSFFSENPYYSNIFFHTLLQPPKHLIPQIHAIREEFNAFYAGCFEKFIGQLTLRDGISMQAVLEYFMVFSETYNACFKNKAEQADDLKELIDAHENKMAEMIDLMLYGVVKRPI